MANLNPNDYAYLWNPSRQMLDKNGKPLVGGYVMINMHGTTGIPAVSYCDWNGTLNARKILLDGLGRASAIVENDKIYDMYVYNSRNVLMYSALGVNCEGEGGGGEPLRFTSSDGSIIVNRTGSTVDLKVHQDPNTYGTISASGTDSNGVINFTTVSEGNITVSEKRLMIEASKLYHVTVKMEFHTNTIGYNYADCRLVDSEGGSQKFHIDESIVTQYVELSWDFTAEHNWIQLSLEIPSSVALSNCVVYMHRVNPIAGGGGGGGGAIYTAGDGINIDSFNVISTDMSVVQPKLIAGSNIVIDQATNTISATATPITVDSALSTTSTNPVQNKVITTALNTKANSSSLATVATTGSYNDLTDKPIIPGQVQADWTESDASSPSYIEHKPTLATVATSGSYNDLSNKPTIPAAQVNSDWNAASGVSMILNKPNLATVATTGSYNDLTDKPTIPAIPVTDVQVNNTSVVVNGVANVDLTPYAQTSSLATVATSGSYNDLSSKPDLSVFARSADLATVATTGDYDDLTNKPSIPAAQVNSDWNASSGVAEILNKPSLATVATSGSYNDLSDKPSIPAAQVNSDWNATSGVAQILNKPSLATVATTGDYVDLTNKPSIPAAQVNSDWNASSGVAEILHKPDLSVYARIADLAAVAFSGDYDDLTDTPDLSVFARSADLAAIATSGSWNDLSNVPSDLVQDASYVHTDNNFTTALKNKLDGIAAGAEVNVQSNWNETNSASDAYIQNKPTSIPLVAGSNISINETANGLTISATAAAQVNSDWNATSGVAEILNKPANLVQDASYVHTDNNFTTALKDKLDGIAAGAEVNVQADWFETNSASDAYIQNKPTGTALLAGSNITLTESASGVTISATTDPGVNQVPAVTSSDDRKFLIASYSNNTGTYSWESRSIPVITTTTV